MAVTKMAIKDADGLTVFNFTYPSSDVFLKERNYFVFEGVVSDHLFINSVKIGDKTLSFGDFELLKGNTFYLDVSAYYAKYKGNFNVTIEFNDGRTNNSSTVTINATTYDCYDPFKEITGSVCNETGMAMITPPNRMLWNGTQQIKSLFAAKRAAGTSTYQYRWNINGTDDGSTLIRKNINIGATSFVAKYIRKVVASGTDIIDSTITRSADVRDATRDVVYVTWRTRWGLDVSHVFYFDTYATDKDNAQEVESEYYYKEHSKHVIKGSFYLDNIREPYDLWYYQTLANSELVVLTFDRWDTLPATYMPNGTNAFNGVKITGCNIKDAVVDGLAQSTITFDFEMR